MTFYKKFNSWLVALIVALTVGAWSEYAKADGITGNGFNLSSLGPSTCNFSTASTLTCPTVTTNTSLILGPTTSVLLKSDGSGVLLVRNAADSAAASLSALGITTTGTTNTLGNGRFSTVTAGVRTFDTGVIGWSNVNDSSTGTTDTAFSRISAGIVGVGTGAAGSVAAAISFTGMTAAGSAINFTGLALDTGKTDATACIDTTTGQVYKGTGAIGICLGTSSSRFKTAITALVEGLDEILGLEPVSYKTDSQHGDPNKTLYGFTAEQGGTVLPALMGKDDEGRPNTFDYLGVVPVLVNAIKQQQAILVRMKEEIDELKNITYTRSYTPKYSMRTANSP